MYNTYKTTLKADTEDWGMGKGTTILCERINYRSNVIRHELRDLTQHTQRDHWHQGAHRRDHWHWGR